MSKSVFVKPRDGWVGDVIPFADPDGSAQLYYLHDTRDSANPGMAWHRYETDDFARFTDRGESLPHGDESAPDLNVYTGSVVESEGVRHAFYTGYNPEFHGPDRPAQQLVMHASSEGDGAWQKHPDHTFSAPEGYEPLDFRDPFVFRPDEDGPWCLLVIARRESGADRRRGVILEYSSTDLNSWAFEGEFWAPNRYVAIECPEVFRFAGTWYLVYSEFSDRFTTRYRMGPTARGPWSVPVLDTIDGRAFYAAKSLERAGSRYFAGWIPTRSGETDDGAWEWAGSLGVHEARALDDGTLAFGLPSAVAESFAHAVGAEPRPVEGAWQVTDAGLRGVAPDSSAVAVTAALPDQYLFEATITADPDTVECGVILRASDDGSEGYLIRLEPRRNRLVFDRWPRPRTGPAQWQISGDVPFAPELERQLPATGGRYRMRIVVDGTICVTYIDDQVAMSARMYDRRVGSLGLFVGEGAATFTDVSISTR